MHVGSACTGREGKEGYLCVKKSGKTMAWVHGKTLGCGRQCNSLSWLINSVSVYLHEPMSHESINKMTANAVCRLVNKLRGGKKI